MPQVYNVHDRIKFLIPDEHAGNIRYAFDYFNREKDPRVGEVFEMANFINMVQGRKCFVDIGSLFGIFSLVFTGLNPDSTAIAIEPSQQCLEIGQSIMDLNSEHKVEFIQTMLGDKTGDLNVGHDWMHLIVSEQETGETMRVQELDDLVVNLNIHPDTLKIDTEGYEVRVLRGAMQTLESLRPIIFLEAHHEMVKTYGNTMEELGEELSAANYSVYDFHLNYRPNFLEFINSQAPHPVTRMLCLPN